MDINTIRCWLGHVSLETTNIYAETDLAMKAKALAMCEVKQLRKGKPWRDDPDLCWHSCRSFDWVMWSSKAGAPLFSALRFSTSHKREANIIGGGRIHVESDGSTDYECDRFGLGLAYSARRLLSPLSTMEHLVSAFMGESRQMLGRRKIWKQPDLTAG